MSKSVSSAMAKKDSNKAMEAVAPRRDPVGDLMKHMAPSIQAALPKHMDPERFGRIMITTIKSTPELLNCLNTPAGRTTLLGALMQCAQLGLDPGPLGHAYIIPFKRNPRDSQPYVEAVFVPGYKGLIDLARRSGHIKTIYANPIREGDEFTVSYGVGGTLTHIPGWQNSNAKVLGYYAFAELIPEGHQFVIMSKSEVEAHRARHSKSKYNSPWDSDFDEMAKKTLIRRLVKILPMTADYASAFMSDERSVSLQADGQLIDIDKPEDDYVPAQIEREAPAPAPVQAKRQPAKQAQITTPEPEPASPLQSYSRYGKWKEAAGKIHDLATANGFNPDKVFSGIAATSGVPAIENVPTDDLDTLADRLDQMSNNPAQSGDEIPGHVAELMGFSAAAE